MRKKMRSCGWLLIVVLITGCHSANQKKQHPDKRSSAHQTNPDSQSKAGKKNTAPSLDEPVAVFNANKEDAVTDNDFTIRVFPTEDPEQFRVSIRYGGNSAQDKISFPSPKYYKKVALKAGKSGNICLLGFIGKDGSFNEMKEISCTGTQIKIKSLKAYYFTSQTKE